MEALFKRNIQSNHNYECKMLKQVTSFRMQQKQHACSHTNSPAHDLLWLRRRRQLRKQTAPKTFTEKMFRS